ncbi:MAG: GNAT family N-acetyltransferase [Bacteroidota bacterium]
MSATSPSIVKVYRAESDEAFDHIFNIRTTVFVKEESVDDEDEYDGFDHLANHYLALLDGQPVGTARWRIQPNSGKVRMERFAVLKPYRRRKIGSALMERIIADIGSNKEIYVHVQPEYQAFFASFGLEIEGETFEEAGMLHQKMVLEPKS